MLNYVLKKVLGTKNERELKKMRPIVARVSELEPRMKALKDEDFPRLTAQWKQEIQEKHRPLDELLPEAFALVREAGVRALGMRHFDVQLIGGMVLHKGRIAEMKTGEGKTLVATLPCYLNALEGRGVHVVTVNDYLARRDSEWMGRLHAFCGLTVGVVVHGLTDQQRQAAYRSDITYGQNNEFGFDYLRDNMKFRLQDYVQRELNYAIVDEVDSILIDEARTPLIISGPSDEATDKYYIVNQVIPSMIRDVDFTVDEKTRTVVMTDSGVEKMEKKLQIGNLYDPDQIEMLHHVEQALRAHHLYRNEVDYVVKAGEVIIVDEFTGRLMPGRRWSDGLHQAVEAKEGVKIENENQTLATISFQNYFRMYSKLAGMTGTADTEAEEFGKIYNLDVTVAPTHRNMVRKDAEDLVYKTEREKFDALCTEIEERNKKGQPILVGTVSVAKSEVVSSLLKKRGVPHNVLNAKNHQREAEIVAQAGRKGSVTISTNMAGRGTDIVLGGNHEMMAKHEVGPEPDAPMDGEEQEAFEQRRLEWGKRLEELKERLKVQTAGEHKTVVDLGGLHILGTERHESRRIDNQLRGRAGRQGDPGESRFYLSLEDELMRLFATGLMSRVMDGAFPDDMPLESKMVSKSIERAQRTVEDRNFEIRKDVLKYDEVMNEQRKVIYRRRQQILDGEDLRDATFEAIEGTVNRLIDTSCQGEYPEDWDLDELHRAITLAYPTELTREALDAPVDIRELRELVIDDAVTGYEAKEESIGAETLREIERRVMLSIIDQGWREHLYEMDYLREGINLRAMGQRDPLAEWQREGFDMFEAMMGGIEDDFVQYVSHLQVVTETEPQAPVRNLQYSAPEDPVAGSDAMRAAASAAPAAELALEGMGGGTAVAEAEVTNTPVRVDKTPGRNEPCYCGSGKKYKLCHGR